MQVVETSRSQTALLSQIHGAKCWPTVSKVSPCEEACPIHQDVPSYVIAIAQGKFKEALWVIRQSNPFPSVCGRVCHHPCEAKCNRLFVDKPIAIQWLKRVAADHALRYGEERPERVKKTKERVAVIGSGPAGLTAAYDLTLQGYDATVYEARLQAGGMLAYGIPEFVLPREALEADLRYIKDVGVEIRTGLRIGKDLSLEDLKRRGFKAILLATGSHRASTLGIPGAGLDGVGTALEILSAGRDGTRPSLEGRVVVVIGGGNVAVDAARTALRFGAKEVHLTCLECYTDMPAYTWEVEEAEREGVVIHPSMSPQEFTSKDGRRVSGISFREVTACYIDDDGRMTWDLAEGSESSSFMPADTVIVAIGQAPDPSYIAGSSPSTNRRGAFIVDPETMATNAAGLFAVGDAVTVAGSVSECIAAGHRVAVSIDRYLRGEDPRGAREAPPSESFLINEETPVPGFLVHKERWLMPALPVPDALRSFEEVKLGFTERVAMKEAARCLNCRMCGNCIFEVGQLCFETGTRLLV